MIRLSPSRRRNGRGNNLVEVITTEIESSLKDKTAYITAVELGHVGIPLAEAFGAAGFGTIGIDTDESVVDKANADNSPGLLLIEGVGRVVMYPRPPWHGASNRE